MTVFYENSVLISKYLKFYWGTGGKGLGFR